MTKPTRLPELTLGETLHLTRFRAGLTTVEMARQIRVAPNTIRNWEADRTTPGYWHLLAWAELVDLDPAAIDPDIRNSCSDRAAGQDVAV